VWIVALKAGLRANRNKRLRVSAHSLMISGMPTSTSSRRAPAMTPDERRAQLEGAAINVLRDKGLAATTKEIAEHARVAEGTIFRVFDTKDDLVQAALIRAFDPESLIERIQHIDSVQPLRQRLLDMVTAHQDHLVGLFELMSATGMVRPPGHDSRGHNSTSHDSESHQAAQTRLHDRMLELIAPDADLLTLSPEDLLRFLRMLTFSGSHRHIAHGDLLTPQQIVDVLLDGTLKSAGHQSGSHQPRSTTTTRTAATSC